MANCQLSLGNADEADAGYRYTLVFYSLEAWNTRTTPRSQHDVGADAMILWLPDNQAYTNGCRWCIHTSQQLLATSDTLTAEEKDEVPA